MSQEQVHDFGGQIMLNEIVSQTVERIAVNSVPVYDRIEI